MNTPDNSPLGKTSAPIEHYTKALLFPIPRDKQRASFQLQGKLPFFGQDIWTAYELSWLNAKGKPMIAMAEISIPCDSSHLIESKSLKLYLNSFNQTVFKDYEAVRRCIESDLAEIAGTPVNVTLLTEEDILAQGLTSLDGVLLDSLDIACNRYQPSPNLLKTSDTILTETLYSHLLKSNCPVTGQPDWATVSISYTGQQLDKAGLLQYIVSYRHHQDFHEHCVEQIFLDITQQCKPSELTIFARFTRRGGLDINPYRSSKPINRIVTKRLFRQ